MNVPSFLLRSERSCNYNLLIRDTPDPAEETGVDFYGKARAQTKRDQICGELAPKTSVAGLRRKKKKKFSAVVLGFVSINGGVTESITCIFTELE